LFPRIVGAKTTQDAWKILQETYHGSDQVKVVKLQTLKTEFDNLKMQEAENVSDYCVRVNYEVNNMATLGEIVNKEVLIKKVLRSLKPRWNHVSIISEEIKDLSTLQFDHLIGSIISHEERLIDYFGENGEKYFSSKLQIKRMKMSTLATKATKAKVEVKIRIIQEEEVVQEEEAKKNLIKEISSVIIIKGMFPSKGIVD
jgi:hypothetical protein